MFDCIDCNNCLCKKKTNYLLFDEYGNARNVDDDNKCCSLCRCNEPSNNKFLIWFAIFAVSAFAMLVIIIKLTQNSYV